MKETLHISPRESDISRIEAAGKKVAGTMEKLAAQINHLLSAEIALFERLNGFGAKVHSSISISLPVPARPAVKTTVASVLAGPPARRVLGHNAPAGAVPPDTGSQKLPRAERKILTALAQHPQGLTRRQLAVFAGYAAGGGGFGNALGALRTDNFIRDGGQFFFATHAGPS